MLEFKKLQEFSNQMCTHRIVIEDENGSTIIDQLLSDVRIQKRKNVFDSTINSYIGGGFKLYYFFAGVKPSFGLISDINVNDMIVYDNQQYTVQTVDKKYWKNEFSHLEVTFK